jgi:response regulator of citrate/malate metabolism
MFVLKSTHEREINRLRIEIRDLTDIVENVSPSELARANKRVEKVRAKRAEMLNESLQYEETPVAPYLAETEKTQLPPRSEYDDRVKTAIEKFRAGKNVSQVMVELHVAKKTARRYLKIAVEKRKVKKADFDNLNV